MCSILACPPQDLSDADHEVPDLEGEDSHNVAYDHEAFLGQQESKVFDQLTPEESKRRLEKLVHDKIDANKDGIVSEQELHDWIRHSSRKYVEENRDKHWSNYNRNDSDLLSWETYRDQTFGDENSTL